MKVIVGEDPMKLKLIKNMWSIEIETMEGDADDYHRFSLEFEEIEDFKKCLIQCEVLDKQYPNGRGGGDDYNDLDFFEEVFDELWHYACDGQFADSMDGYVPFYYNAAGDKLTVDIEFSKEDSDIINEYGVMK